MLPKGEKEVNSNLALTKGAHHVGLTVSKLEESANFFVEVLGWAEVKRDPEYPSVFVTDGTLMVTLWSAKTDSPVEFDKNENVGLHHMALSIDSFDGLDAVYNKVLEYGSKIEFSPELLGDGPAKHMMCYDPSGIRLEFICIP